MFFVDPLKLKLKALAGRASRSPLADARAGFGSPRDFGAVSVVCDGAPPDTEILVDLTPFERIGSPSNLYQGLHSIAERHSITFLASEGGVPATLEESGLLALAGIAVYDSAGAAPRPVAENGVSLVRSRTFNYLAQHTLSELHSYVSSTRLISLLPGNIVFGHDAIEADRETVAGREYIRLTNGMLVSCYLSTKRLFSAPPRLFDVAFEAVRALYRSFRRDLGEAQPCDLIVAPSNSSLVISSAVHALTGIQLCVIDRIGPVPSHHLGAINSSLTLRDRRVGMIVEVTSTGSEIDRTLQYLDYRRASIERVVCCYSWSAARPHLCDDSLLVNLCEPKRELGYVYRSAP